MKSARAASADWRSGANPQPTERSAASRRGRPHCLRGHEGAPKSLPATFGLHVPVHRKAAEPKELSHMRLPLPFILISLPLFLVLGLATWDFATGVRNILADRPVSTGWILHY